MQGLAGFKDDCELGKIEPSHIGQRTCPDLLGDIHGVGEGVTTFAQPHQGEWRRQVDWLSDP
jgi:hypothetical protein